MTKKIFGLALGSLIVLGLTALPETKAFSRIAPNPGKTETTSISNVTWEKATQKDGLTVTPGSARADFGRFNFYCNLDASGRGSLVTITSQGGGELPPKTERLFLLHNDNRSTTLLQQWYPLANSRQPIKLKPIVTVNSEQLFMVLPKPELPTGTGRVSGISSIKWGRVQRQDQVVCLPGKIRIKSGIVELFWKVVSGQIPELVVVSKADNVKQSGWEERLFLVEDPQAKTTTLYQERQPLAQRAGSAYLWPVAVVKTRQLMVRLAELRQ